MNMINCVKRRSFITLKLLMVAFIMTFYGSVNAQEKSDIDSPDSPDSLDITYELNTMDYVKPTTYILADVRVHGVKYVNSELIISSAGLVRGEEITIPGDHLSSAIRKLWSQRFYSDIKTYVTVEGINAYIDIYMKERPRISKWEINGLKPAEKKKLLEELELPNHSELSDYVIHGTTNNIKNYFFEKGFLNTNIEVTQRIDTAQQLKNSFVILTFNVDKGKKLKIKNIDFEGNIETDSKKLRGALKGTKEKTILNLFKTAKFDQVKFDEDKLSLVDYLQSKGYRNASVISDSMYNIGDNRLGIKIKINEGHKYYFRNITWTGNVIRDTEMLNILLGIEKGDVYDKKTLESRLGTDQESAMSGAPTVSSIYQNAGHLTFMVEPIETVISGDSIDMDIRIAEGKPFTVNEVQIIGNTRTTDRVIRRELLTRPGELYSQELLISSLRQIQSMGHFTDNMNPVPTPVSDELVDIAFNLEERPNDQFELSGGWGNNVFVASVGVTFNNVSMRNFLKKDAWRPYPTGDNQKLSLRIQTNGLYYQSYQASFYEPWLGGKKPNSFSVSGHYSKESNVDYWDQIRGVENPEILGSFATVGATISYGKRLSWPDPFFTLSGSLSYQAYILDNYGRGFKIDNTTSNIVTISGRLERNSVDHPIFPRNGSQLSFQLSMTPPYSAFRSKDFYTNPELTDNKAYNWIEYYQLDANIKWYLSTLSNNNLVFMASADFGYLGHYRNQEKAISIFEGYSMGGDGVSGYSIYGVNNIGLRGYENDALTPNAQYGDQARLYNKFIFEIRYPIIMEASTQIFVLGFAEAGNAFNGWRSYNPFNLKRSAGVGLRLYLPIVGMFGIDWGYGFDRTPGDPNRSGSQFHFSIGSQF